MAGDQLLRQILAHKFPASHPLQRLSAPTIRIFTGPPANPVWRRLKGGRRGAYTTSGPWSSLVLHSLSILAIQHTQPLSISGSHQDLVDVPFTHIIRHLCQRHMRANGGWPRLHDLARRSFDGGVKALRTEVAEDDAGIIHDHTPVLT